MSYFTLWHQCSHSAGLMVSVHQMVTCTNSSGGCSNRHSINTYKMKRSRSEEKGEETGPLLLWAQCQLQVKSEKGQDLPLASPCSFSPSFSLIIVPIFPGSLGAQWHCTVFVLSQCSLSDQLYPKSALCLTITFSSSVSQNCCSFRTASSVLLQGKYFPQIYTPVWKPKSPWCSKRLTFFKNYKKPPFSGITSCVFK